MKTYSVLWPYFCKKNQFFIDHHFGALHQTSQTNKSWVPPWGLGRQDVRSYIDVTIPDQLPYYVAALGPVWWGLSEGALLLVRCTQYINILPHLPHLLVLSHILMLEFLISWMCVSTVASFCSSFGTCVIRPLRRSPTLNELNMLWTAHNT